MTAASLKPLIIAHRGASAEAPENTLAAITQAIALQVNYVEIDVRLSKEGVPVVLHDPSAARMTGNKDATPIRQLTLPQIKEIAIGKGFNESFAEEKIPTLMEVLDLNWKNTGLMIEIKKSCRDPKILANAVYNVLKDAHLRKNLPQLTIGSFSLEIVKQIQKLTTQLKWPCEIMGIIEKPEMMAPFIEQKVHRLALWYRLATWDRVHFLRERNMEIWTFTVDDPKIAKHLISLGINGIISNNPRMMIENSNFNLL